MFTENEEILRRALERERKAKEIAEDIIENRIRELYDENISLSNNKITQEKFQKNLIDNLVDALMVFDFKMNIIKINKKALKLLGTTKNKAPTNLNQFKPIYREKLLKLISSIEIEKEETNATFIFNFINRKRQLKYVNIKTSLLYTEKKKPYAYQAIIRDITKEHLISLELKEQQNILNIESLILKDLIASNDLFQNGISIVNHIANYLGTDDCVLYAIIEDKLVQVAATGKKLNQDKSIKQALKIDIGEGIVGAVALSKKGIITKDTRINKNYIIDDQIRLSEITVPIILDGKLIGIIDAEHLQLNYFKKKHLTVLTRISNLIGIQLKNALVILENETKQIELKKTQSRLKTIFESELDARVIESKEGFIEKVNNSFLNLFNIPLSKSDQYIGMDPLIVREQLKSFFIKEDIFSDRIEEIIKNGKIVLNEILELKDGRILSRNFTPLFIDGKKTAQIWNYRDITLKINYDKGLEFQSKKYKSIIQNMNLGLMEVDNNDIILNINNAFVQMSGFSSKELLGSVAIDTLLGGSKKNMMRDKIQLRKEGAKDLYEIEMINKSGEIRYWLISGAPNTNINGEIKGSIGIHLDITDYKLLNIKADQLINDLTIRNEELSHYAHVVSHDLKSPLRTVSTCINWILEDNKDKLDVESLSYIKSIEEAIKNMDKLITSTLQYSEIRTSIKIADKPIELEPILESILNFLIKNKKDDFNFNILKPLPSINLNEVKARQLFQNLIENAYKYRDKNKKSFINIDWEENDDYYQFMIQDNGIGIEKQYHEIIFEAFKKINNRIDSSGIGLFIIKKIITSYGGKIWIESEIGMGTTFYFTILK